MNAFKGVALILVGAASVRLLPSKFSSGNPVQSGCRTKELSGRVSALEAAEGLPFRVFFSWSVLLFERLHITSSAVMVMAIMSADSA